MKKIIVFGGAGFLGSHICDKLSIQKYKVTIFDKINSPYLRKDQKMIIGDIFSFNEVNKAVKGNDLVFNFAGLSDIDDANKDPIGTVKSNILGNTNILESCRKRKVSRFIFASTVYVYSNLGGFYRASKQACENYIENYNKEFGLKYSILRYGSLYGPRSDNKNGIYRFISSAIKNNTLKFNGSPESIREFIHVEDAAESTLKILNKKFINKHIIITGNQTISINNLFKMICEILSKNKITIKFNKPKEAVHYKLTPYGFNPKFGKKILPDSFIDLGQGLLQIVENIDEEIRKKIKY